MAKIELDFPLGGTIHLELSQFEAGVIIMHCVEGLSKSESQLERNAGQSLLNKIDAAMNVPAVLPDPIANRLRDLINWVELNPMCAHTLVVEKINEIFRAELEMPKCEYCGATRRECSGCGGEVGHTVIYANTRQADTTLERNRIITALSEIAWCRGRCETLDNANAVTSKLDNASKILRELLEGQSKETG